MFEIITNILVFIAIGGIVVLIYEMEKELDMNNTPKIYHHGNMIDIEIAPLSFEEINELTEMSFSWQPDLTDTRLRMYGSEGMMWGLAATIQEAHPEYTIIPVKES